MTVNNIEAINNDNITYSKLYRFFIPLGLSTFLIAFSNLLLNKCLAYIPNAELYISSFSVARTFTLLFMSPVSAITLIITSFTVNKATYKKVAKFALMCGVVMVIIFYILSYTDLGRIIFNKLYNLEGELLENTIISFRTIIYLPVLFLIRNFFLAIAIKLRNTKFATLGSLVRVLVIFVFTFFMPEIVKTVDYQILPGIILFFMVLVESLIYAFGVFWITRGDVIGGLLQSLKEQNTFNDQFFLSYKKILMFAIPLILSFSISQLMPSFTQSALATGQNTALVLSIYTIIISIIDIIGSFSFQLPQLVVNHDSFNPAYRQIVRGFFYSISAFLTLVIVILAFTGLGDLTIQSILKLSPSNLQIAKLTLKMAVLYPAASVFMSYKRGKLIKIHKTSTLIFERAIASVLPFLLFFIIPVIPWEYGAGAGVVMLTIANFSAGLFSSIIFKYSLAKNPNLLSNKL